MLFPHLLVEGRTMSGSDPFYYCLSQSNAHNQLCGDLNAKTPTNWFASWLGQVIMPAGRSVFANGCQTCLPAKDDHAESAIAKLFPGSELICKANQFAFHFLQG